MSDFGNSESLCRMCGRCCREKVEIDGVVFYTDRVCRWWDPETKLCTVYDRRGEVCPDCADIDRAISRGILPRDCPYVAGRPDYDPPVEFWDDPEVEALIKKLPPDPSTVPYPRESLRPGGTNRCA